MMAEGLHSSKSLCFWLLEGIFSVSENRGVLASGHPEKETWRNVTERSLGSLFK